MSGRAAIYCRVSTTGQEDGTSLDSQLAACRAYADARGYEVGGIFREVYSGGELYDRPQLSVLRAALRRREFATLLVYAVDRLSRDQGHLGVIFSEADHFGYSIECVSEPLDRTPEGKLLLSVRGYAAEVERAKIRDRTLGGKRARIASGKVYNYGRELYGYRRDKQSGTRRIEEGEAAIVRRIYRLAKDGLSIQAIKRLFDAEGIPTPRRSMGYSERENSAGWSIGTLNRILHDSTYKGEAYALRREFKNKRTIWRDRTAWLPLPPETTPAIVTPELWQEARERLTDRATGAACTRNQTTQYLLRGMVRCAVCGGPCYADQTRGHRVYRCASRRLNGKSCGGRQAPADALEKEIWDQLTEALRNPTIIARELEQMRSASRAEDLAADRAAVARQLARIEREQARIVAAYTRAEGDFAEEDDALPIDLLRRELARTNREKTRAQGELAEIDRRIAMDSASITQLEEIAAYMQRMGDNLAHFGFEERRDVLLGLAARVIVNGHEWEFWGGVPREVGGDTFHFSAAAAHRYRAPRSTA